PLIVKEIFRIIERLRETGVTILLVEQNARAALDVADHGYVLETGEIALHGPAAELAGDARVVETYLDSSKHDAPAPHGLDHSRIGHVLGYAVAQAEITTRKIYSKYIGHPMELRPVEFTILMLLLANERVTQKQLCQALVLSAPNLTVLLDKLQERGLLTRVRSDVDRRS